MKVKVAKVKNVKIFVVSLVSEKVVQGQSHEQGSNWLAVLRAEKRGHEGILGKKYLSA